MFPLHQTPQKLALVSVAAAGPGAFAHPWAGEYLQSDGGSGGREGSWDSDEGTGIMPRTRLRSAGLFLCHSPDSAAGDSK